MSVQTLTTLAISDPLGATLYGHFHVTFPSLVWINAASTAAVLLFVPFLPRALLSPRDRAPAPLRRKRSAGSGGAGPGHEPRHEANHIHDRLGPAARVVGAPEGDHAHPADPRHDVGAPVGVPPAVPRADAPDAGPTSPTSTTTSRSMGATTRRRGLFPPGDSPPTRRAC